MQELARDSQDGLDKLGPAPEEPDKSGTANSTCAAQTSLTLERALSLYQMDTSKTFYEVSQDTRCLVGWGSNSVVVAFRGTASVRNALADLQVLHCALLCLNVPSQCLDCVLTVH